MTFRRRDRSERGAAVLELAIAIPLFLGILALIFDAGMGFAAARSTSASARGAARAAALAGDHRLADFRALDAVRAEFAGNGDTIVQVTVYLSPAGSDGSVPGGCGLGDPGVPNSCNVYTGAFVNGIDVTQFDDPDCAGEADINWCPTTREDDDDDYLGVAVWSTHEPTIGLGRSTDFEISDSAVFALYFPEPVTPTP